MDAQTKHHATIRTMREAIIARNDHIRKLHSALGICLFAVTDDADANNGTVDRAAVAMTARNAMRDAVSAFPWIYPNVEKSAYTEDMAEKA
jgi:hypothetical protein